MLNPTLAPVLLALALICVVAPVSSEPRVRGGDETARHPVGSDEPARKPDDWSPGKRRPIGTIDPAVQQFWSERCVQQRRYGLPHTKDCDNPAYTGGSAHRPYRPYRPSYGYPPHRPYWREGDWHGYRPSLPYSGVPEPEPRGRFRLPGRD